MRRTQHRQRLLATTVLAACLVLTSCGGDDEAAAPEAAPSDEPSQQEEPPPTWPLTGLPADDSSEQEYPVMVLKLDNTSASSPQLGLGSADLVVEELVEGGSTRLAAFYYSEIPGDVGPVRSMRASDIGIVSPVDGTMVTSGAAAPTITRLKEAGVGFVTEGSAGFFRDDTRVAPYNLFTDMTAVAKSLSDGDAARPDDYLPWGEEKDLPKGDPASGLSAVFSAGRTTTWSFKDGGYVNEDSFAEPDDQFPADTVLVLRVQVGDAGYLDPAGNPVPETDFTGDGEAMLFHGGEVVEGTWNKKDLTAPLTLEADGEKLTVPAGHTWIELVPADGGDVTVQR